jgi:hypothetical protein
MNPWGMALAPSGPWWVADNGKGISTLYSGDGMAYPALNPLIVTIPPPAGVISISAPSGLVYNGSADFTIDIVKPARFIFVTEDGTISEWNPEVDKFKRGNERISRNDPGVARDWIRQRQSCWSDSSALFFRRHRRGRAWPFRVAQTGSLTSTDAASACHVMVSGTRFRYERGTYDAVTVRQNGGCSGSHYLLSRLSRPPASMSSISIVGSSLT